MPPTQTQNRKDLLQAYRLMTQRTALALIAGEPDSPNQPLRRRNTATVSGILVAVIACVLFGVLGLIGHTASQKNLTRSGTLVVDKDTATAYVPCNSNELCPALNYTSALLALQKNPPPSPTDVSQGALAGYKIGPTVGIAGLPQDLPTSSDLVKGPWAVCDNGAGVSTLVGGKSVGGTALRGSTANLVQSGGQDYVLQNGQRMQIPARYVPLTFRGAQPQQVTAAWLNAVPAGPDFAPPAIADFGKNSTNPSLPGKIGQVFTTSTGPAVLEQDGKLHSVTSLQSLLLQEEPGASSSTSASTGAENSSTGSPIPNLLPSTVPHTASVADPVCVTYPSGGGKQTITAGATIPANATQTGNSSPTTVNQVWLPSGKGALIGMVPGGAGTTSVSAAKSWVLLSGATRYGLGGSGVAGMLGYNLTKDETVLPASLVSVLPEGQGLDPTAASQPASG